MKLPLDELRYLEALDRLGSAAAAARELGVATSTVYRKIDALERELGIVCLSRGGGVTVAGREIAQVAQRGWSTLGDVIRRLTDAGSELAGSVSITTVSGFVPLLAAPLARLTAQHPELKIELHVKDDGPSVRDREVDIALSVVAEPPPQLVGRRVLTIRYGVFGLAAMVSAPAPRWVVLAPPMQATEQARWEAEHVPADRIAAATGARLAFLELVRAGVGVGVLPKPLASRYPELVPVQGYEDSLTGLDRPAWLLTHADLKRSARIDAVMAALGDALDAERA